MLNERDVASVLAVLSFIPGGEFEGAAPHAGMEVAEAASKRAAKTATQLEFQFAPPVEQYALRASENGFYPVMVRGLEQAQFITYLEKGDVWKFGTTVNPATRYSLTYLESIGEHGVEYSTEFFGNRATGCNAAKHED